MQDFIKTTGLGLMQRKHIIVEAPELLQPGWPPNRFQLRSRDVSFVERFIEHLRVPSAA